MAILAAGVPPEQPLQVGYRSEQRDREMQELLRLTRSTQKQTANDALENHQRARRQQGRRRERPRVNTTSLRA